MDPVQIILYIILAAFLLLNVRRFLQKRSVPQIEPSDLPSGAVLLDVRTAGERSAQSIRGSIHIPLHELRSRAGELRKHRDARIVCYCQSGSRSLGAAVLLKKLGFDSANLVGGIANWNMSRGRGRPVF